MAIHDLEGELFFGAAPELERHLQHALDDARARGIHHIVLRVKRARAPDAVCLERLEHTLREAQREGVSLYLAGVRADLMRSMKRLEFARWLPEERWFPEEDESFSATLGAVRQAYAQLGIERAPAQYYLV